MIEEQALAQVQATDILAHYRALVWPVVQSYLVSPPYPPAFAVPAAYGPEQTFHWSMVREYPLRQGKYLRPTLLLLACEALGGDELTARNTAAAMQLSEEWILIHDDLEDGSIARRGKATLHRMYGHALATNAGDALHAIMWKALFENTAILGAQKTSRILEEFFSMISRTIEGQSVDLQWVFANHPAVSDRDCFFLIDGKASYYTIGGPLRLGAIVAEATQPQLDALAAFAVKLGRCFQLVDDVLDVTQDFRGLKNQRGNDIYESKRTVLLRHLLHSLDGGAHARLLSILEKPREAKTSQEVTWVIEQMHRHGSIEHAKELAQACKEEAAAMFSHDLRFLARQPARDRLEVLMNFVLERDH